MPMRFTLRVDGVVVIDRAFNRVDQQASDMRNFAPGIAGVFYAAEERLFQSEGASGASGKWAALSKAYARFKARNFPGKSILKREDTLYESLTNPEAPDAVYRATQDEIVMGTRDPKALAHHRGRGRLPARPVVSLTESDKRLMQKSIQADLVRFTRQQGFHVEERAA